MAKFWLHISQEEQLARFQARENTPEKAHKITEEDYRNREKWDEYVTAVDQMVVRTSSRESPWHIIPANDKLTARLEVLDPRHRRSAQHAAPLALTGPGRPRPRRRRPGPAQRAASSWRTWATRFPERPK